MYALFIPLTKFKKKKRISETCELCNFDEERIVHLFSDLYVKLLLIMCLRCKSDYFLLEGRSQSCCFRGYCNRDKLYPNFLIYRLKQGNCTNRVPPESQRNVDAHSACLPHQVSKGLHSDNTKSPQIIGGNFLQQTFIIY